MYLQNVGTLVDLNGNACNYLHALLHGIPFHIHCIQFSADIRQYDSNFNQITTGYICSKKYDAETINKYENMYNTSAKDFIFKVDVKASLYRIPRTFAVAYYKTNLVAKDALILMREHIKLYCLDVFSIILEYYLQAIIADLSMYTCVNPFFITCMLLK